ncbi:MAG: hypothetical protein HY908_36430 [Myxococcales bacterium]|nr:hypothetical protein [Myxococcales bacterium]
MLSLSLGASAAPSEGAGERATLVGADARAAFTLGKRFWRSFAPYAVVRLFGGPALWRRGGEALVGTDRHHYQLGAGLLVTGETVGASLEVVPLGERNVTVGTTVAF